MNIRQTDKGMELDVIIDVPHGLHARPCARVAKTAREFKSEIHIASEDGEVDAKSMLDILSLALRDNTKVTLIARGDDARDALLAISKIMTGFRI